MKTPSETDVTEQPERVKRGSLRRMVSWLMCKLGKHRPVKGAETIDGYYQRGHCRVCQCEIYRDMHWLQGDMVWRKPANESSSVTRHTERNKCKPQ